MSSGINLFEGEIAEKQVNPLEAEEALTREVHASREHVKRVVEALLFATNAPLPLKKIKEITDPIHPYKPQELALLIEELKENYARQERAFNLEEIGGGYILRTTESYREYVDQLYRDKKVERLSQAALEVLSIVAFKQPITKPQIEAIRGVDSSGILQNLIDRQLVHIVGQLEVPGRPNLYGVTDQFLHHFGLNNLDQLKSVLDAPKDIEGQ